MEYVKNRLRSLVDGKNSPSNEPAKAKDNKAGKNHFEKVTPGAQPKPALDQAGGVVVKSLSSSSASTVSPSPNSRLPWLVKSLIGIMAQSHEGEAGDDELRTSSGKKLNILLDQIAKLRPTLADSVARAKFDRQLKSEIKAAILQLQRDAIVSLSVAVRAGTAMDALRNETYALVSSHAVSPEKREVLELVSVVLAEHLESSANLELQDYEAALQSFSQLNSGNDGELRIALDTLVRGRDLALEALVLKGVSGIEAEEQLKSLEASAITPQDAAKSATTLIEPLRSVIRRLNMADPEHRAVKARMSVIAAAMERLMAVHAPQEPAVSEDKRDGKREVGDVPAKSIVPAADLAANEAIEHAFNIALCPDNSVIVNVAHATFSPEATRFMTSQLNGEKLTTIDGNGDPRKSVREQIAIDLKALAKHGESILGMNGERAPKQFFRDAIGTEMLDASGKPYFTQAQRDNKIAGSDLGQFRNDAGGSDRRAFLLMMVMSQTVQSLVSDLIVGDQGPGSPLVTEGGIPVTIPLAVSRGKLSYQCTTPPDRGPSRVRAYGFFPDLRGAPPRLPVMPADSKQSRLTGDEPVPELVPLDPRKSFFTYTMDITIGDDGVPTLDKPVSYSYRLVEGEGE